MIRRHIPKGTNFDDKTDEEIERITIWLNNYPRGIFGYGTSQEAFDEEIKGILNRS